MAKGTPLKKLTILGDVSTYDYHAIKSLQKEYAEGNITLIESSWGDRWKNNHPDMYNLPECLKRLGSKDSGWREDIWCTYAKRLRATLSVEGKKIYASVVCEEGELLDGRFKNQRWTAKFQIKATHLKRFKSRIDYLFTQKASYLYERELSLQAKKRIEEIEKELLN